MLIGMITCYDSADYLDLVIQSALEWLDHIIVVEGAFQITMDIGLPQRSQDGTLDILKKYENNPKVNVTYPVVPPQEHKDQYQIALDAVKQIVKIKRQYKSTEMYGWLNSNDWAILIDSDEIYPRTTQNVIRRILTTESYKTSSDIKFGFRVHSYNFINDFNHYYNGIYPRIFLLTDDAEFVFDNEVRWPAYNKDGDDMLGAPSNHIGIVSEQFRFYHYVYVKNEKYLNNKARWMYQKDQNIDYDPKNPKYRFENGIYKIPDDIEIMKFTGRHPKIVEKHFNLLKG